MRLQRVKSFFDRFATAAAVMAMSVSYLVYIIAFQYLLAYKADLFPINGYEPGLRSIPYLVLPGIIILMVTIGPDVRIYRTVFLDEIRADYVRTARAKGLAQGPVLFVHALKNAAVPIVTVIGIGIALLIGGAVVTETVFAIPGLGRLTVDAILRRDYPVIQGVVLLFSFVYVLVNLAIDLFYTVLDPRIRY